MAYKIKVACEIANKKYEAGQIVQEWEVAFYPSLMEEVNSPKVEKKAEAPKEAPEKAEEAEIEEPIEAPKKKKK